jgi:hypothetical protein
VLEQDLVEQDFAQQELAKQELAEPGFAEPRSRPGRGTARECIACAERGRLPCSMRRLATRANESASDLPAIAGAPRNGSVALIDDAITENTCAR